MTVCVTGLPALQRVTLGKVRAFWLFAWRDARTVAGRVAAMNELKHVLQRVFVRTRAGLRRPPGRVRMVMTELALLVHRDHLFRSIEIYVGQLAAQVGKDDDKTFKTVRRALRDCDSLGLIRRRRPEGQVGANPAWPLDLHPALLAAAEAAASVNGPNGWEGVPIVFPREWSDTDPSIDAKRPVTWEDKLGSLDKLSRKKGSGEATPPRGGAHDTGQGLQGPVPAPSGAGGVVHLNKAACQEALGAIGSLGFEEFWAWLEACSSSANWAGSLLFCGQRRSKSTFKRGGVVQLANRPITGARAGAYHSLIMAVSRGGLELTFRAVGEQHPLLLVDDLNLDAVDRLRSDCARGIAFVETSPGNHQATLVTDRQLSPAERLAAQRALVRRFGGDVAAVSASQLRRFPGSVNGKPLLGCAFHARLLGTPPHGAMPSEFLAELLAEGALLDTSDPSWRVASVQGARQAMGALSASQEDWKWLHRQLDGRLRGRCRGDDEIVEELAAKAFERDKRPTLEAAREYARHSFSRCVDSRRTRARPRPAP